MGATELDISCKGDKYSIVPPISFITRPFPCISYASRYFILHYISTTKGGNWSISLFNLQPSIMNHFLHLLVLLPALFTTIFALPFLIDDTSNSWTDSSLDNADILLAATFGGATDNPLTASPSDLLAPPTLPATNPVQAPPPPPADIDLDWSKPMFLCCTSASWLNDEEVNCTPSMECIQCGPLGEFADLVCVGTRSWNDENCMAGQGTAKYCPRGISVSFFSLFFFWKKKKRRRKSSSKWNTKPEDEKMQLSNLG